MASKKRECRQTPRHPAIPRARACLQICLRPAPATRPAHADAAPPFFCPHLLFGGEWGHMRCTASDPLAALPICACLLTHHWPTAPRSQLAMHHPLSLSACTPHIPCTCHASLIPECLHTAHPIPECLPTAPLAHHIVRPACHASSLIPECLLAICIIPACLHTAPPIPECLPTAPLAHRIVRPACQAILACLHTAPLAHHIVRPACHMHHP